jgi:hypothetical protein
MVQVKGEEIIKSQQEYRPSGVHGTSEGRRQLLLKKIRSLGSNTNLSLYALSISLAL